MPPVNPRRLIAIGDVHGERESFKSILRAEDLIDPNGHWSGHGSILLQIGDMIDRGPASLEAMDLIRDIQKEAEGAGGRVIRLLGNHEILVLQGLYYYCNFQDPKNLGRLIKEEVATGKIQTAFVWEGRLYVHAGIRLGILEYFGKEMGIEPTSWSEHYEPLAVRMNQVVKKAVEEGDYSHPVFWADASRGGTDPVGGVFWSDFKDLVREGMNPIRQVVGHTPAFKKDAKIYWTSDKTKINIDAGMYQGYGGNRSWLTVEEGHLYAKQLLKGKVSSQTIE